MAEIQAVGFAPEWRLQDRLRRAREFADLHQADLALEIGISRRSLGKYEAGEVVPRTHVLMAWALRCGVPYAWLTEGAGSTPRYSANGRRRQEPAATRRHRIIQRRATPCWGGRLESARASAPTAADYAKVTDLTLIHGFGVETPESGYSERVHHLRVIK